MATAIINSISENPVVCRGENGVLIMVALRVWAKYKRVSFEKSARDLTVGRGDFAARQVDRGALRTWRWQA
ncbi:hypothetical protein GCM10022212_32280 [Actimicrobium antarcticum]|uniref:Uncharacterized protein n=1 Tax=Actimicrobium antarcticum TaxID=1051899 RepID=A0ABP7TU18_9BURK